MDYEVVCKNCKLHCSNSNRQLVHSTKDGIETWKCKNFQPIQVIDRTLLRYLYNGGRIRNLENYVKMMMKNKEP